MILEINKSSWWLMKWSLVKSILGFKNNALSFHYFKNIKKHINYNILIKCAYMTYINKLIKTRKYGAHAMTVPKSSGSIQPMRGPLVLSSTPLQQEAGGNTAVIILGVKLIGTGNGWGFPLVPVVFVTSPS